MTRWSKALTRGAVTSVISPPPCGTGRLGGDPLLPRGGRLGGQVQRGDARVMQLEVAPEQPAEHVGELVQGGVVDGGLAFAQVVHQQVPDRAGIRCRSGRSAARS